MYPGGPVDPVLQTIARRIGGTPGQVIFKWAHAKGFVVVTTTAKPARLDEYLRVSHLRASPLLFLSRPRGRKVRP
jgi:diketogulonate reductase-like aldo/keto reductase